MALFFKPKWMSKNETTALSCINTTVERTALAAAALESPHASVRKIAASRTVDAGVLEQAARKDPSVEVRQAATQRIQDQAVLADIAKEDDASAVRSAAIENLTDPEALYHIAMTDPSTVYHNTSDGGKVIYHLRLDAVKKIQDQKLLHKVAINSTDTSVSMTAAELLSDRALLVDIVLQYIKNVPENQGECQKQCCKTALANPNLNEESLFAGIITSTCPTWMKACAIQRLRNKKVLQFLAQNDDTTEETKHFKGKYYPLREEAQRRLLQLEHM